MKYLLAALVIAGSPLSCGVASNSCGAPKSTIAITAKRGDTAWGMTDRYNPNLDCDLRTAVQETLKKNNMKAPRANSFYNIAIY